jgi:hypothetical protein
MKSGWKLWSGQWEFSEGSMKGTERAEDHRAAVASCVHHFRDAIVQFDFQMNGCRQIHFRFQYSIPENICRVIITEKGFSAQKDDHDHGGPDLNEPFGNVALSINAGEWKTLLVEIKGQRMAATIDGQTVSGSHPLIGEEKAFFDFLVSGESARFRNLRMWEALARKAE